MKKVQILSSFIFLFSFSLLHSQVSDDSLYIRFFNDQDISLQKQLDTSLSNLYFYRPTSSFTNFAYNTGNIGLAFVPLTFRYNRPSESIFRSYNAYMITSDSVRYFKTKRPYTEFFYTQGLTTEHFPGGLHAQQLNKNLGLSLMYQAISSGGEYQFQKARGAMFYVAMDFTSSNKKFSSYFNLVFNKLLATENGGLTTKSDSLFRAGASQSNRQLFTTALSNTSNTLSHRGISWKNYLFFAGAPDSVPTSKSIYTGLFNEISLFSSYILFSTDTNDIKSGYMQSLDTGTIVNDSMNLSRIDNYFGLAFGRRKENILPFLKFGWRQQWNNIHEMNAGFAEMDFISSIADSAFIKAFAQYGIYGRRSGDIKSSLIASLRVSSGGILQCRAAYANQQSSYFDDFSNSYTNLHNWTNNFQHNSTYDLSGSFSSSKWKFTLDAGYQGVKGYIYFDESAKLMQNNSMIHTYYAAMFKTMQYRWIRSRTYLRYQNSSSSVILMPEFMARQELTFLINYKAIHAEVGFLMTYFTSYKTYAYDPSLRDYYIQNSFSSGNYPFLDFYAALKVGPTRIFFKADHFNAPFSGGNYEMLPYYPMTDLTFKLGLKWGFWN
ncbi:MAG: putative porin [Flavobacteriales bacterium]